MKQRWRLLAEFRPAAGPSNHWEVTQWLRQTLPELGVANPIVDRVVQQLAETAMPAGKDPGEITASLSYQVVIPAGKDTLVDETHDWAFFLVTGPHCRSYRDRDERRGVIQVFLYPATRTLQTVS